MNRDKNSPCVRQRSVVKNRLFAAPNRINYYSIIAVEAKKKRGGGFFMQF